jgi:FkbM family methyltransferase
MMSPVKRVVYSIIGPEWFFTLAAIRKIHGDYEPSFREFLAMVPPEGTMLDVGANFGINCAIAKRNRPGVQLIAFEPVPQNVRVLRRIKLLYSMKRLEIHPVAVGDHDRTVSIAVPTMEGRALAALCHVVSDEFKNPEVERYPYTSVDVRMLSLDSFRFEHVDAIKIDVEDHEYHVLNGARQLLRTFRPIVFCELWDTPNRTRSIDLMTSLGYSVIRKREFDFLFTPIMQVM